MKVNDGIVGAIHTHTHTHTHICINLIDEKRVVESYSKNIVNFYNRLLFSKHSHCVY